jgi:hypothetical protein
MLLLMINDNRIFGEKIQKGKKSRQYFNYFLSRIFFLVFFFLVFRMLVALIIHG